MSKINIKPEEGGSLINTFAGAKGLDIKNVNELMNWVVFGDVKEKFFTGGNDNNF